MKIEFYKYQGAGNDFIIIDNRDLFFDKFDNKLIEHLCNRKKGVGADGLILLQLVENYTFEMLYFNADGFLGSMCGNGGRCIVDFAKQLNLFDEECEFLAFDGSHHAKWNKESVSLSMQNVHDVEIGKDFFYLDRGSPHYVKFIDDLDAVDILNEGSKIRFNKRFKHEGTNVNFVHLKEDKLHIRTYERGVENETLACGTGVVAAVIAAFEADLITTKSVQVIAKGGDLKVTFEKKQHFYNIYLVGPYESVFKGEIKC